MLLKKCDSCWSKVLQRPLEATLDFLRHWMTLKRRKLTKNSSKSQRPFNEKICKKSLLQMWDFLNALIQYFWLRANATRSYHSLTKTQSLIVLLSASQGQTRVGLHLKNSSLVLLVPRYILTRFFYYLLLIYYSWLKFWPPHQTLQVQWHCVLYSQFDGKNKWFPQIMICTANIYSHSNVVNWTQLKAAIMTVIRCF